MAILWMIYACVLLYFGDSECVRKLPGSVCVCVNACNYSQLVNAIGLAVAQRVERWICDQQVVGSNPTRGKSCVTTLGKLFTPMCFCHQAV